MRATRLVQATALILGATCLAVGHAGEKKPGPSRAQPVKIIQSWSGKLANGALRKLEPADGFMLDQQGWAKLWKAWRGQENVPAVDFQKEMVLVFTAGGPNSVGCNPTHDGKGNVRADAMSTLIGGPGFGYLILCIPREGVKTVNGKPLPGVEVPPSKSRRPKVPRNPPGVAPGGPPGESPSSSAPGPAGIGGDPQLGLAPQAPPIKELSQVAPKPGVFDASSWKKPLVLRSEKEAAEHFPEQELAKLTKQVDFVRQFVLVFAWRGSGQDRLEHAVAESYPEQVFFTYKPGRTRDLREHVRVYALRSNVRWSVKQDAPRRGSTESGDTPVESPAEVKPPLN